MPKYKAALHLHVKGDPSDNIKYTSKEAILKAKSLGFSVIAITCHLKSLCTNFDIEFGKKHGVLVIPGIEAKIEGKELIILNFATDKQNTKFVEHIKTFAELRKYKKLNPNIFVYAPHPYYFFPFCMGKLIYKHNDIIDGVEWSYFYSKLINPNKKAAIFAKKFNKPLLGTSDIHNLNNFDHTYTVINCEKLTNSAIISALKNNQVDLHTKSFSFIKLFELLWNLYKSVR